jgi:hypothetical protein
MTMHAIKNDNYNNMIYRCNIPFKTDLIFSSFSQRATTIFVLDILFLDIYQVDTKISFLTTHPAIYLILP